MVFEKSFMLVFTMGALAGCTKPINDDGQHKIGVPLTELNTLQQQDGSGRPNYVIYDRYIGKIHNFDINNMKLVRSQSIPAAQLKHFPVSNSAVDFIGDICDQSFDLFDRTGATTFHHNFLAKPVSAAYREDLGLLIVYDELQNILLLKLDSSGNLAAQKVVGAKLPNSLTISAGDIVGDGLLALALSDDSIAIYDINSILANGWPTSPKYEFPSGLNKITWVAPVRNQKNLILVASGEVGSTNPQVALIDYSMNTQNFVDSFSAAGLRIEKYSKTADAHLIYTDPMGSQILVYPQLNGRKLMRTQTYQEKYHVLASDLNLVTDVWTFILAENPKIVPLFNDADEDKQDVRTLFRYGSISSTMLALSKMEITPNTQLVIGNEFYLELFPSDLGRLDKKSYTGESSQLTLFNLSGM